jgi:hypothetical protein
MLARKSEKNVSRKKKINRKGTQSDAQSIAEKNFAKHSA